jgi:hypothetical protein
MRLAPTFIRIFFGLVAAGTFLLAYRVTKLVWASNAIDAIATGLAFAMLIQEQIKYVWLGHVCDR